MRTVTGVFASQSDAQNAMAEIRSAGAHDDRITLLTPGNQLPSPSDATPGLAGAPLSRSAIIPGVGPVTAVGRLGAAVLASAGATIPSPAAENTESPATETLLEAEIFVYEDALRRGHSVLVALPTDETEAARLRELLQSSSENVDTAREQWWTGLRSAEEKHYSVHGRNFRDDEFFYRLGFEAALHARTRCKEYDQTLGEMDAGIEDLEKQFPGREVAEPFSHGYERGRDYYQQVCDGYKAA
jgi:hypothetical protein